MSAGRPDGRVDPGRLVQMGEGGQVRRVLGPGRVAPALEARGLDDDPARPGVVDRDEPGRRQAAQHRRHVALGRQQVHVAVGAGAVQEDTRTGRGPLVQSTS